MKPSLSPNHYKFIIALYVIASLLTVLCFHYPLPYYDHFSTYFALEHYYTSGDSWLDLLKPAGEHALVTPYLLQIPLAILTNWSIKAEVAMNMLLYIVAAILLIRSQKQTIQPLIQLSSRLYLSLVTLCILFVFSLDQAANFFWGWQTGVAISIFGLSATIYALTRKRISVAGFIFALLAALASVYAYAASFSLWAVGIFLIATHPFTSNKNKLYFGLVWLSVSAATLLQRMSGTQEPANSSTPIIDYVIFLLNFLGSPVARFASDLAIPLTLISMILLVWMMRQMIIDTRHIRPEFRVYIAYIIYAIFVGILMAAGRVSQFGVDQAFVARYITFSNFYWLGFLCLLLIYIEMFSSKIPFKRFPQLSFKVLLVTLFVSLVLLKSANIIQQTKKNIALTARLAPIERAIQNGTLTPEQYANIYVDAWFPKPLPYVLEGMKKHQLGMFRQ